MGFFSRFVGLPPIIYKRQVGREQMHGIFRNYADFHGYLPKPTTLLTAGFHAKGVLLSTSYISFLQRHAEAEVYDVELVMEFEMTGVLAPFVDQAVQMRRYSLSLSLSLTLTPCSYLVNHFYREADASNNPMPRKLCKVEHKLYALTPPPSLPPPISQLGTCVSASFGYSLLNPTKFTSNRIVSQKRFRQEVCNRAFLSATPIGLPGNRDELFEVTLRPNQVWERMPICLGSILSPHFFVTK